MGCAVLPHPAQPRRLHRPRSPGRADQSQNHDHPGSRCLRGSSTLRLAVVLKQCGEDQLLSKLSSALLEQLSEEYPDMLGSIIAAEGAIANVVDMTQMNAPVKDFRESFVDSTRHIPCLYPSQFLVSHRSSGIVTKRCKKLDRAYWFVFGVA